MIPDSPKLCECGCGRPAPIAKRRMTRLGHIKGQPVRYIAGHNTAYPLPLPALPNPSGLCQCGCGQPTPLARQTARDRGHVRGQPVRFLPSHNSRLHDLGLRFWAKVDQSGGPDACWPWTGKRHTGGYGRIIVNNRETQATRLGWEVVHGEAPPPDKEICHKCDNPPCCNPSHWFLGTHAENMTDARAKGITAMGERGGMAKLTAPAVLALRANPPQTAADRRAWATAHGVSVTTIDDVLHRKSWKHL